MKITVRVTADHIRTGRRRDGSRCPIAKAVRSAGFTDTYAGNSIWWTDKDGNEYRAISPDKALGFMTDFDSGKPVKPFSFTLIGTQAP